MTIKEKINVTAETLHATSLQQIHLWKEGVFWVAYEQSAYAIWLLKKYKPVKKFIKSVGMEVVSIGFPATALASVEAYCIRLDEKSSDTHLVSETTGPFDETAFSDWKNAIPRRDVACNVSEQPAGIEWRTKETGNAKETGHAPSLRVGNSFSEEFDRHGLQETV